MLNINHLLKINTTPGVLLCRMYGKHNKKYLYKDGKLINNTITYYPRREGEQDPAIEPSKLFRVHRIKKIEGNPHWEKRILRELGLFEQYGVAIVKNIPENNARLWKIKHLIKITPIQFPNGEPTAEDIKYTYLKENGDCIVIKDIDSFNKRLEASEAFNKVKESKLLESETLKKDSRLKWLNNW